MLLLIQDKKNFLIPRFNYYSQLMQLTQVLGSSYSLGRPAHIATTTTRVTHKTIVGPISLRFILKDLVSRLCVNLELYLSLG